MKSIKLLSVAALVLGSSSIALAQGGANTGASGFVNPNCLEQPGTTGTTSGAMGSGTVVTGSGVSGNSASQTGGSSGAMSGSGTTMATGPSGTAGAVGNTSGNSARQTGGC
jgi:hypothetical protein